MKVTREQTRRIGTHSVWVMAQEPPFEAATMSKAILFRRTVFSLGTFQYSARTGWGFTWSFCMCCDILQGSRGDRRQVVTQGEADVPPGSLGSLGWLGSTALSSPRVQGVPTGPGMAGQRDPCGDCGSPHWGASDSSVPSAAQHRGAQGELGQGRPRDSCIVWH